MIANTKLKEFTEELRKKYKNVQKQLELLQMNTHLREEERNEKEGEKVQSIYTGISMYQLPFRSTFESVCFRLLSLGMDDFVVVTGKKGKNKKSV